MRPARSGAAGHTQSAAGRATQQRERRPEPEGAREGGAPGVHRSGISGQRRCAPASADPRASTQAREWQRVRVGKTTAGGAYDADNYSLKLDFNECEAKVPKGLFVKVLALTKAPLRQARLPPTATGSWQGTAPTTHLRGWALLLRAVFHRGALLSPRRCRASSCPFSLSPLGPPSHPPS